MPDLKEQLKSKKFMFKHKYGQNFLTDANLLKSIVNDANISEKDNVLEIGAGAGTLTRYILERTKNKVVAVEIDKTLQPILEENLKNSSVQLEFSDFLKIKPEQIKKWFNGEKFKVVANLPYYISTPILFYLIDNQLPVESITVMLQLELAQRLSAKPGTKDYGALTVLLSMISNVSLTRKVSKKLFFPEPKVDSAVVNINFNYNKFDVDFKLISKFIKNCFMMRRKTLINNIMNSYNITREEIKNIFNMLNINENARAENLTDVQFVELFNNLENILLVLKE